MSQAIEAFSVFNYPIIGMSFKTTNLANRHRIEI
jgi:hypothetical protein